MVAVLLTFISCVSNREETSGKESTSSESQSKALPPSTDIHTATFLGDLDAIRQHIAAGSDLNEREPSMNSTPLIAAAVFGKTEVAKELIEAGADVDIQNNQGSTALHSAAFLCRTEIVKMLLENDADKDIKNIFGSTALESVEGPFNEVKLIYDEFSRNLGPMGFKLDYEQVEASRPVIAEMLR
ncbi:MAG: ankyrin repeat domain-containing protein [Bacteroidetes bacterium]|nr:ankyrin repeat domain-containing protein [Bacteroidota bacterium]